MVTKYCEVKNFYNAAIIPDVHMSTTATEQGTAVHESLERDINGPDIELLETSNATDQWASKFLKMVLHFAMLHENQRVRELYVLGIHDGELITGIIDLVTQKKHAPVLQNSVEEMEKLVVVDTKTRSSKRLPNLPERLSAYHQVLIYNRMLRNLTEDNVDWDKVFDKLGLHGSMSVSDEIGDQLNMEAISGLISHVPQGGRYSPRSELSVRYLAGHYPSSLYDFVDLVRRMASLYRGTISNDVLVEYLSLKEPRVYNPILPTDTTHSDLAWIKYQYDDARLDELLDFSLKYWREERQPLGVQTHELATKCKYCMWAEWCSWKRDLESNF